MRICGRAGATEARHTRNAKAVYDYVTRAHIDPQAGQRVARRGPAGGQPELHEGRCDLKAIVRASFERTDLRDRRYAIIDYPWYDPVTKQETTKRALVFRIRKNFVVGSGFTLTQAVTKPNVPLIALVHRSCALFLFCAFVFPGLFYTHGHILTSARHASTVTSSWGPPNTYIVWGTVALTLGVAYVHSRTIRANETIKTTKLVQQLVGPSVLRHLAGQFGARPRLLRLVPAQVRTQHPARAAHFVPVQPPRTPRFVRWQRQPDVSHQDSPHPHVHQLLRADPPVALRRTDRAMAIPPHALIETVGGRPPTR